MKNYKHCIIYYSSIDGFSCCYCRYFAILGLIVPNIISMYRGDHLKNALPHTLMLGSIFVLFADIIGRLIVYPYEINIGLTIGVFGTVIFLILLMKGRKHYAN